VERGELEDASIQRRRFLAREKGRDFAREGGLVKRRDKKKQTLLGKREDTLSNTKHETWNLRHKGQREDEGGEGAS